MPKLSAALGALLGFLLFARPARSDDGPRWDLDARVGYAASFTTAQSHLGFGTGLAGGATFGAHLHVEVAALYQIGTVVSASNASIVYWSREWSLLAQGAVGYELWPLAKRLVVRPALVLGGDFLSDTVQVGGARRSGLDAMFTVGPGAAVLARFGDLHALHAGLDGRALFVPSRVAAPIGGIYAVFGLER